MKAINIKNPSPHHYTAALVFSDSAESRSEADVLCKLTEGHFTVSHEEGSRDILLGVTVAALDDLNAIFDRHEADLSETRKFVRRVRPVAEAAVEHHRKNGSHVTTDEIKRIVYEAIERQIVGGGYTPTTKEVDALSADVKAISNRIYECEATQHAAWEREKETQAIIEDQASDLKDQIQALSSEQIAGDDHLQNQINSIRAVLDDINRRLIELTHAHKGLLRIAPKTEVIHVTKAAPKRSQSVKKGAKK